MGRVLKTSSSAPVVRPPKVPAMGWHEALVKEIQDRNAGAIVTWSIDSEGKTWVFDETMDDEELLSLAHTIFGAEQEVEIDDLEGRTVRLKLQTRGGRQSGQAVDFAPARVTS